MTSSSFTFSDIGAFVVVCQLVFSLRNISSPTKGPLSRKYFSKAGVIKKPDPKKKWASVHQLFTRMFSNLRRYEYASPSETGYP